MQDDTAKYSSPAEAQRAAGGGCAESVGSAFLAAMPDRTFRMKKPCPYCGGKITVRATAWTLEPDGWVATELDVDCSTEPDIDSDEWEEWMQAHGETDYGEAWHRHVQSALAALNRRVRFNLDRPNR